MKITLFGASGKIGQQILLEALVRGHSVKALVRHPDTFPITHPRLTVAYADIFDSTSITEAVTGSDVAVNATGASGTDPQVFYVGSTKAMIEAMRRVNTMRLIVVGGAGSLEVAPGVLFVDTPHFRREWELWRPVALAQCEILALFRSSDINWTFFSPSASILPGKRTGQYRTDTDQLLSNSQGESSISIEDYAVALLDEIERPQFIRQRFTAVSI